MKRSFINYSTRVFACGVLVSICSFRGLAFDAKKVAPKSTIYAVCFDEHDSYRFLRRLGLTNCLIDEIQRNSAGTAVYVQFQNLDLVKQWGALVLRDGSSKIIDLTPREQCAAFFDNLQLALSFRDDYYSFSSGDRLPWKCGPGYARLHLYCAPGAALIALRCSDSGEQTLVYPQKSKQVIFTISTNELLVEKVFYRSNQVCLSGPASRGTGEDWECLFFDCVGEKWTVSNRVRLPAGCSLLDIDKDFSRAFCSKSDFLGRTKGVLFNLNDGQTTDLGLTIWRRHGLLLEKSLVQQMQSLLKGAKDES